MGHRGEQLTRDLAGAARRGKHLLDLAVHPDTEAGGRVASRLALVLRDRRDPHFTGARQEVAASLEVAQPLVDDVERQVDAPLDEIVRRPLSEQRAHEEAHDRDVARRLGGRELVQLYRECWEPDTARMQRLQGDLDDYASLVVQARPDEGA